MVKIYLTERKHSYQQDSAEEALEATGMRIKDNQTCFHLHELDESGKDLDEKLLADVN